MRAVKNNLPAPSGEVGKSERPSPGQMARLGKSIAKQSEDRAGEKYLPVGGRVRRLSAVGIIPLTPYEGDDDLYLYPQPWTGGRSQSTGRIVSFLKEVVLCGYA
jgi:hypothetical protein